MQSTKYHHTKKYEFLGEEFGASVADFLNTGAKSRRERIKSLLLDMRDVPVGVTPPGWRSPTGMGIGKPDGATMAKLKSINRLLSRYRTAPLLWPKVVNGSDTILYFRRTPSSRRAGELLECDAANSLMRLAELGLVEKIRQCKHCEKWLFARTPVKQYCDKECQVRYNASSETTKRRRRENYRYKKFAHPQKRKGTK